MAWVFTLRIAFLLGLALLAVTKNVAPSFAKEDREIAENLPRKVPRNQAPTVRINGLVTSGAQERAYEAPDSSSTLLSVPESHVFYKNYQANFSWSDPKLQAALGIVPGAGSESRSFKRDGIVGKRSLPGGTADNPVFKASACAGCLAKQNGEVTSLSDLTVQYLRNNMLVSGSQLKDKCVFYTSVPDATSLTATIADKLEWWERVALGGASEHRGLSLKATQYACGSNKLTIWNLYPGKNDVTLGTDSPSTRNFWEVYVQDSWLNFLLEKTEQYTYFERMSTAMAEECGGTVYVMTMRPKELSKYQFIWGKYEYPTLRARYDAGIGSNRPTKLIAIDAKDPTTQYNINFATQEVESLVTRDDPDYWHGAEAYLEKRDTCSTNIAYEATGEDWFG